MGRDDGDGGIEWCGRNVNDEDVAWLPDEFTQVSSVHDVLANGAATAAGVTASGIALIVLTDVADLNGDFAVSGPDLGMMLAQWGQQSSGNPWIPGDLDRSGQVGGPDLGTLLARWTGGEIVQIAPGCADWVPIEPLDIEGTLQILGFDGLQQFGEALTQVPSETAAAAAEYVHLVAQVIHLD
ncbi:MAG: hypothetical protein JNK53_08230 [Phycisphaerae bacterium]|nr:hypothetical protein [Phycisphaerae bacterium]